MDFAGNPPLRSTAVKAKGRDGLSPGWAQVRRRVRVVFGGDWSSNLHKYHFILSSAGRGNSFAEFVRKHRQTRVRRWRLAGGNKHPHYHPAREWWGAPSELLKSVVEVVVGVVVVLLL